MADCDRRVESRASRRERSAVECHSLLASGSSSGALIEEVDRELALGAFVEIWYKLESDEKPTLLHGKVSRVTDSGFAVEFVERRKG